MGSKYPPSMRGCLPLWTLLLVVAFIVIFFFFTSYDTSSQDPKELTDTYRVLQDVTIMMALGFGFINSSLRRYGWSSMAFNLFLLALTVQWAVLLNGFLEQLSPQKVVIKLSSIKLATMSAMSVLISAGAVLGKANLVQLVLMALVEVTAFGVMRMIQAKYFVKDDHVNMMHIHVFAAYFGLMVAWSFRRPLHGRMMEKYQTEKRSSLFGMLGTLFLWIFWPSFNSALLPNERKNAMFNTYYALAVSTVTAISVSSLAHPQGKINMHHIHNAVLAGGVAVGTSCYLIRSPWLAMVLGLVAGLISTGGALSLTMRFNNMLDLHDTSGVYYTFGLPGLLGEIAHIVLITLQDDWTKSTRVEYQLLLDIGALSLALAMGLIIGLLTGLVLNLKIWKGPHMSNYFDDQLYWKFPHLAVGF
ncbi:blood group Rh(CE) polypeptide [Suricata suricatta]|uniref:Ammonium transporter AmtB-like domain-containing protein n=1 Tax=Suricata suricatta TaxID=37032 RepID=A0A673UZ77_SURSU|nr:blood group Rh(CE) polypeptide [Suricata suricatta]